LPPAEFEVNVIALNRGGYYAEQLRAAGIPVEVLQKRFRFDPLTYVRLRRKLRECRPDVVQSFLFSANSYIRLPGISPAETKVIVSERCVDSWKSGWQLKLDRWLSGRMHAMTANSASVAEFYRQTVGVSENLIHTIPNGVAPVAWEATAAGGIRQEFGLPPDARLVGFVGRLAPQKCLRDLIWAFQLLHQVVDNVYLVLVGEGPERDSLADLATSFDCRDKVIFTGHREDARAVISQLDLFCLPSSFEGMSNSLMEAMAFGVPVVVSDIPANLELVRDGENGMVFPLGMGPELTKACKRILDDSELAKRLGGAAKMMICEEHSVERLVENHVQLYRRLAEG
jgi:glycosyltransferase involved in cell wall biosynthesis